MRDEGAFFEWAIRNKFFDEFAVPLATHSNLQKAIISLFFAGRVEQYEAFNNSIAGLKRIKVRASRVNNLRTILNKPEARRVKAAFIVNPWHGKKLNSWSGEFKAAMGRLMPAEASAFNDWMTNSYRRFRNSRSALRFAKSLSTAVCPYCDKAFLDIGKQFYGELDHYLDKSQHSYYALNIHNFVPVCGVCNRKKSKQQLEHFHHTEDDLDSVFRFYLSAQDKNNVLLHYQSSTVKVRQKEYPGKKDHLNELQEVFALDDRYENMSVVVDYLAQLKRIYTPEWLAELESVYKVSFSRDQIKQLLLGQFSYRDPAERLQPLTKLINDLVEDLDVFNERPLP